MKRKADRAPGPSRRRRSLLLAALALMLVGGGAAAWAWRDVSPKPTAARQPPAVPVTVATATRQDVPVFLEALGTVQAVNTIAVRSQIDGPLQSVNFTEGQEVHQGDTLAVIDPRPLRAMHDQALAKKGEDQAMLVAAQKDLERSRQLATRGFATPQTVDQQQAKADQLKATLDADQAAIDSAQTQLSYATITAPISGRVGFRQVDAGNIVRANDPNPITVLTQIRPSLVVFTLPQKNLGDVREAMLHGPVRVIAFDQNNTRQLAEGELMLIDNQIDQATSTIRLKARFANDDDRLWPGEFVRLRIQVDTRKNAVTIPPVAMQRGPQGFYAWVIGPDNTADQRPIDATPMGNDVAIVTRGLDAGERVVVNGQYRLQPGTRVDAKTAAAAAAAAAPGQAS